MPTGVYERQIKPNIQRFLEKIEISEDGCWCWTAGLNDGGYGTFRVYKRKSPMLAHVFSYEFFIGEKAKGLDFDHLCRRRSCVNPWHLEPVTRKVNCERGMGGQHKVESAKASFSCTKGHPYTPQNVYINAKGNRVCRPCKREWQREYRALNKAA